MRKARVSSKYQIVLPPEIRQALGLKPGQEVAFLQVGRSVRLVPIRPIEELRGSAPNLTLEGLREKKDRPL